MKYLNTLVAGTAPQPGQGSEGTLGIGPHPFLFEQPQPDPDWEARPRRILMTTAGQRREWEHSLDLAAALGRCGIEVALAVLGSAPSRQALDRAHRLSNLQVYQGTFGGCWTDDAWGDVERAGDWLVRLEHSLEPDLVHLHAYPLGALPFRAPHLLVGHDCPVSRWQALRGNAPRFPWRRYMEAATEAFRSARLVVVPTAAALEELSGLFGLLPDTRLIPAGRSARGLLPGAKEELVLAAGSYTDGDSGLETVEQVAGTVEWPLVILAEDPEYPVASDGAVRIVDRPSPDSIASWYGRASVYTQPCRYTASGLGPLEAALAGCALVLGDVPALRETWEGAALFVQPGDPLDLGRALELLLSEPKGLRGLAQRARSRALLFSPERRAGAFLEAYADVVAGEVRPRRAEAS